MRFILGSKWEEYDDFHAFVEQENPDKAILDKVTRLLSDDQHQTWDKMCEDDDHYYYNFCSEEDWFEKVLEELYKDELWDLDWNTNQDTDSTIYTVKRYKKDELLLTVADALGTEIFSDDTRREIEAIQLVKKME